jgi:cephalosporin-C deacetylase
VWKEDSLPVFKMPLEQLHSYQGINPKPEDFEESWQRALGELRDTDDGVELLPAAFGYMDRVFAFFSRL